MSERPPDPPSPRDAGARAGAGPTELERQLHTLAERLHEALVVLRPRAPVYGNPAALRLAERLFGVDAEPLPRLESLVPEVAYAQCDAKGCWTNEIDAPLADGSQAHLRLTLIGLGDPPGRAEGGYSLLLRDVSEARRYEEELQSRHDELQQAYVRLAGTQEQLLQAEKMASIGQLAAGIAHEINNPIGYVHSNLHALQDYVRNLFLLISAYEAALGKLDQGTGEVEEIAELRRRFDIDFLITDLPALIAESREGIERVTRIVQDLKEFSYSGRGEEWTAIDLHKGLESTLNIVWNEIKYKARVVKSYGDLPEVECLPSEINQVFMNLLINAAQALDEQGTISLSSGCEGDEAWVEIADDGPGIAPEHLARIFDPFFTTKPVGKGSGLGLSISYGIVAKHNGRIEVDSRPGQGARFRVLLPLRQPPVPSR